VEKAHLHLHRLAGIQVHTVLYFQHGRPRNPVMTLTLTLGLRRPNRQSTDQAGRPLGGVGGPGETETEPETVRGRGRGTFLRKDSLWLDGIPGISA
jgi:hypothetical protein